MANNCVYTQMNSCLAREKNVNIIQVVVKMQSEEIKSTCTLNNKMNDSF